MKITLVPLCSTQLGISRTMRAWMVTSRARCRLTAPAAGLLANAIAISTRAHARQLVRIFAEQIGTVRQVYHSSMASALAPCPHVADAEPRRCSSYADRWSERLSADSAPRDEICDSNSAILGGHHQIWPSNINSPPVTAKCCGSNCAMARPIIDLRGCRPGRNRPAAAKGSVHGSRHGASRAALTVDRDQRVHRARARWVAVDGHRRRRRPSPSMLKGNTAMKIVEIGKIRFHGES